MDIDSDCHQGYVITKRIDDATNKLFFVESIDSHVPAVMKIYAGDADVMKRFEKDDEYLRLLSRYGIAPNVYYSARCNPGAGIIILEKFEQSLKQLVEDGTYAALPDEMKRRIICMIAAKVEAMHDLGIAHGDLHANNIVLNLNPLRVAIIDYEYAFSIGEGRTNPEVQKWMEKGFGWEGTYDEFVAWDLENWRGELP